MTRQPHAFFGELIEARRLDLALAEAAEFAIAEVVGEYEDDVRLALLGLAAGRASQEAQSAPVGCVGFW